MWDLCEWKTAFSFLIKAGVDGWNSSIRNSLEVWRILVRYRRASLSWWHT